MKTKQIGSINSPLPLRLKIASSYLLLIVLPGVIVFVVRKYGLLNDLSKVHNS